jgi:hypothetical protein
MVKWSCDETNIRQNCRNPFGCHCAEIDHLQERLAQMKKRAESAEKRLDIAREGLKDVPGRAHSRLANSEER